jgi:hypothetical protein
VSGPYVPVTSPPANAQRGEVLAVLGGVERRLCLTLGALAELETAFGADSVDALAARLARPSARDLLLVLEALLRGGGDGGGAPERVDFREAAAAVAAAFKAAG